MIYLRSQKVGRRPHPPSAKFYGRSDGTVGLWLSIKARELIGARRVVVKYCQDKGQLKLIEASYPDGLKISDSGYISASGFVNTFGLVPEIGTNYAVSSLDKGAVAIAI